jgi:GNAT superfamily N-acetyltransferase
MDIAASEYSIRPVQPGDAEIVARHRALMFNDMNPLSESAFDQLFQSSIPWFERLLIDGHYVGWLTLHAGAIVSGGGILLREQGPVPGCPRTGLWGHVVNVYTAPEHRGRGLARTLMNHIVAWAAEKKLDRLTLTASKDGASLYRSIGFTPTADMELLPKT